MTPRRLASVLLALTLFGCESAAASPDAGPSDAGPPDAGPPDAGPGCVATVDFPDAVSFETDDVVTIAADLYIPATRNGGAIVLVHMVPPFNRRTNYPTELIEGLTSRGLVVLNIDRRGAGDSGGVAEEAYIGPNGKLDVKAAVDFLLAHPCAPSPSQIGLVGASNGTTSVLDYTVFAAADPSVTSPAALVFLTGGTYTENQNLVADHRDALDPLPLLFVFSTDERDWSVGFELGAPSTWELDEYPMGAHGTAMLTAVPESVDAVAGFLARTVAP